MRRTHTELGRDLAAAWAPCRPVPDADREAVRSRVLVEIPDGAKAWALWLLLGREGYVVTWCPGPDRLDTERLRDRDHPAGAATRRMPTPARAVLGQYGARCSSGRSHHSTVANPASRIEQIAQVSHNEIRALRVVGGEQGEDDGGEPRKRRVDPPQSQQRVPSPGPKSRGNKAVTRFDDFSGDN